MANLTNYLNNLINEAAAHFWFVQNIENGVTYIVCAPTAEEAKALIPTDGEKYAWLLKLKKTDGSQILFDSEQVKAYGDKKW